MADQLTDKDWSDRLVNMKTMNASEFKAKCLALLDDVAEKGEVITILKHGRPVAQLVPASPRDVGYPQDALRGTVEILGDIIEPAVPAEDWEAESGEWDGPDPER